MKRLVLNGTGSGINLDDNSDSIANRPTTIPTRTTNTDALITTYAYNAAGEVATVTDPNGIVTKTVYDGLGRTTETIAAYDSGVNSGNPTNDQNQTTQYTYDGAGHILTMTADMPSGQTSQTTAYIYNVANATSQGLTTTPVIFSNDLLWVVEYPNPTTGNASTSSSYQNLFTYDALGETLTKRDQNLTLHTYGYDVLGRETSDSVTFPQGNSQNIDTSILRIETSYNTQGLTDKITSYSSATGGSGAIVNQIQDVYNGFGQLTQQYQEHSGAVNTSSTLSVAYTYDTGNTFSTGSRLVSMTYPSGSVLNYNYGTSHGLNDVFSRLDNLSNGTTQTLEGYSYLGLSKVVYRGHPQDGIDLDYMKLSPMDANGDAGDQYTGLDRFGRVVDQKWIDTNNSDASVDEYQYTYDRDGNVTSQTNVVADATITPGTFDETFTYDGLNRLSAVTRNGTSNNYQSFGLDALGNVTGLTNGTNSTLTQTYNSQNELVSFSTASGHSVTITFDNNGNTTTDDAGRTLVYDAWNRLVTAKSGTVTLNSYTYDGMGRRISEDPDAATYHTQVYYSTQGQDIQENVGSGGASEQAQYVWSPVYVNALVLRDYDFNFSGTFNIKERVYALQDANYNVTALVMEETVAGDTDGSGLVDIFDLNKVSSNWHSYVTGGDIMGDLNHRRLCGYQRRQNLVTNNWQSTGTMTWAVVVRNVYDPYGKYQSYNANWTVNNVNFLAWNVTFQGGRQDSVTGDIRFDTRDYNPRTFTWNTQEPLKWTYADGMNLYQSFSRNPITYDDPTGLWHQVWDGKKNVWVPDKGDVLNSPDLGQIANQAGDLLGKLWSSPNTLLGIL